MKELIDKQQAIDKMVMLPKYFDKTGTLCLDYADVLAVLSEHLPSVDPEWKKGKWIVHYECPKCGEITKDFKEYCPFCNADMRGEEDGCNS